MINVAPIKEKNKVLGEEKIQLSQKLSVSFTNMGKATVPMNADLIILQFVKISGKMGSSHIMIWVVKLSANLTTLMPVETHSERKNVQGKIVVSSI